MFIVNNATGKKGIYKNIDGINEKEYIRSTIHLHQVGVNRYSH